MPKTSSSTPAHPYLRLAQSNTVRLLRTLSKAQIGELELFAKSFFCRASKEQLSLLAFLKTASPEFSEKDLTEAKVHRAVFAPSAFNGDKLNRVLSELNQTIYLYIALTSLKGDEIQKNFYVLKHLANRDDEEIFETVVRKTRTAIEVSPEGFQKMQDDFRLRQTSLARKASGHAVVSPEESRQAELVFEDYAQTQRLLFEAERTLRSHEIRDGAPTAQKPPVFARLVRLVHGLCTDPQARVHAFEHVFRGFKNVQKTIAPNEREDIYLLLLHYCNFRFKNGSPEFGQQIARLQVWENENTMFTRSRERSDKAFLNKAIGLGMAGDFKEMEAVIRSSGQKLPMLYRDNAVALATAFLNYFQGNFKNVVLLLKKVNDREPHYKARAHSLIIRAYFEIALKTGGFKNLEVEMEAYKKYFNEKELIALQRRENYLALWNWVKTLLPFAKKRGKFSDSKRQELLASLRETKIQPIGADWLERIILAL